jgi:uncharacterized protein YdeI (YjbR/CyaY-like superfamily)
LGLAGKQDQPIEPQFFATPAAFRAWLEQHHTGEQALWVGFYKVGSGRPSITWPEAVDEALCFGWIDGVRKGIDDASYMIRFTHRKPRSIWSSVNIRRAEELASQGRMHPAGLSAFEQRRENLSRRYSYEQADPALDPAEEQLFRGNAGAWDFFQAQAKSYRKAAIWWVVSAKQAATRQRRLATLIEDSAQRRTIAKPE